MTHSTPSAAADPVVGKSKPRLSQRLGPGLITGAADDDPSGIGTYAQAGAQFGFGLCWTLLVTYPLMVVIQAISARIVSRSWAISGWVATAVMGAAAAVFIVLSM